MKYLNSYHKTILIETRKGLEKLEAQKVIESSEVLFHEFLVEIHPPKKDKVKKRVKTSKDLDTSEDS